MADACNNDINASLLHILIITSFVSVLVALAVC